MREDLGVFKPEIIEIIAFWPSLCFKPQLLFQAFLGLQLIAVLDLFAKRSQTTSFAQDITNCLASLLPAEERLSGSDQKKEFLLSFFEHCVVAKQS